MTENVIPLTLAIGNIPSLGSTVQVTVTFDDATTHDQVVNIASTPSGFFSSIPSQVTLPANASSLNFNVTVATNASGGGSITASCNGGHATGFCSTPAG